MKSKLAEKKSLFVDSCSAVVGIMEEEDEVVLV